MAKYDKALKTKALAIAETAGAAEASRATGISAGTIRVWLYRVKRNGCNGEMKCNGVALQDRQKMKRLQAEVMERAVEEAGDYIAARLKGLADKLYSLAEKATVKVNIAISDSDDKLPEDKHGEPHDRDGAAWVRALVGVMAQSIDKAQLLSGKPTARPEVMERHEYDITKRIIADPEAVEIANSLLRRAADCDAGALRVHGERGPVDTV